jgi:hypothetical protein
VGVGHSGNIVRSTDNGTTWDNVTSGTTERLSGFGNNTFVVVGDNYNDSATTLTSSDNGTTWTSSTYSEDISFSGVTYGNGNFIAVGPMNFYPIFSDSPGIIIRSTDNGTTWDNATSPTSETLCGVVFIE